MYERDGRVYFDIANDFPIEDFLKAARDNPEQVALHYLNEFYTAFNELRHRDPNASWELDTEDPIYYLLMTPRWHNAHKRNEHKKSPTLISRFFAWVTS
jgi:hypothetical protein